MSLVEGTSRDVPRGTLERLEIHARLLEQWNPRINLVSAATLGDLWARHIEDSLQLAEMAQTDAHWTDLGSGGGFPGLVIAAVHAEVPGFRMTLIESDQRKAVFLRTVAREAGLPVRVETKRIEEAEPQQADVLTARALAPLDRLLDFTMRHRKPGGTALFPKGETWREEVAAAKESWDFAPEIVESRTHGGSVILKIGELKRG
ncbi:MAG: 16S rRNA (guanine(527)-N(7))-methyltransferase RsmG [Pseudooceanicola sp.]